MIVDTKRQTPPKGTLPSRPTKKTRTEDKIYRILLLGDGDFTFTKALHQQYEEKGRTVELVATDALGEDYWIARWSPSTNSQALDNFRLHLNKLKLASKSFDTQGQRLQTAHESLLPRLHWERQNR